MIQACAAIQYLRQALATPGNHILKEMCMVQHTNTRDLAGKDGTIPLRTAVTVMKRWRASTQEIMSVLRVSRSTRVRAQSNDHPIQLDMDQMTGISMVLNIHAALRTIFDNPENVYSFPSLKNHNEFFDGRSPLQVM